MHDHHVLTSRASISHGCHLRDNHRRDYRQCDHHRKRDRVHLREHGPSRPRSTRCKFFTSSERFSVSKSDCNPNEHDLRDQLHHGRVECHQHVRRVSVPCRDTATVDALVFGTIVLCLIIVYTRPERTLVASQAYCYFILFHFMLGVSAHIACTDQRTTDVNYIRQDSNRSFNTGHDDSTRR